MGSEARGHIDTVLGYSPSEKYIPFGTLLDDYNIT